MRRILIAIATNTLGAAIIVVGARLPNQPAAIALKVKKILQKRRFNLYKELRSLASVAEQEGVSREAIRQCLEKMPKDSDEYQEYKAIAQAEKGGRPRQYEDFKEHRRRYMQRYRAKA